MSKGKFMNFNRRLSLVLVSTIAASALSGCIGLAATGAAVGVLAVTDRRTLGAQTDDQGIELKAFARVQDALKNPGGVSVTSYNRRVLLTGQVLDAAAKQAAEKAVTSIEGVRQIHNELVISGRSGLGTNANDTLVTTKIKAAFVDAKDVQANTIKVVTEQGIAYLMGILTQEEANRASQVASRVGGVQRVVTVFEIVSSDELRRIEATAGK
jgi:osmotically-inducible protein OsmY